MASKKSKKINYAETFVRLANCAVDEAEYLLEVLDQLPLDGKPGDIPALDKAHAIETKADSIASEIYQGAEIDFITPIDRGDLLSITHALDSVVDELEDIVQELYMYNVAKPTKQCRKMCSLVHKQSEVLRDAFQDYLETKKLKKIRRKIDEVRELENEHDRLYVDGVRELFEKHADDPLFVTQWKNIYAAIENAADTIEHVGVVLLTSAIKND